MKKVLVITGQTATGKTAFADKIATEIKRGGELLNFDARQIYKELSIVTGKDNLFAPIHLYDLVSVSEPFTSHDFVQAAAPVIKDILKRGKMPILVGGTYFYLSHLLYGIPENEVDPNWELRKELDALPVGELQKKLKSLSVETFEAMNSSDQQNPRRLVRRIEILSETGTMKSQEKKYEFTLPQDLAKEIGEEVEIIISGFQHRDTEKTRTAITQRVEKRLEQGAVEEVKKALKVASKYEKPENAPGLQTIGAKQIIDFINGKLSEEQLKEEWISKEVQYAKRQLTFMKRDPHIAWKVV